MNIHITEPKTMNISGKDSYNGCYHNIQQNMPQTGYSFVIGSVQERGRALQERILVLIIKLDG